MDSIENASVEGQTPGTYSHLCQRVKELSVDVIKYTGSSREVYLHTRVMLYLDRWAVDLFPNRGLRCFLLITARLGMQGVQMVEQPGSSLIISHDRMIYLLNLLESLSMRDTCFRRMAFPGFHHKACLFPPSKEDRF